MQNSMMLLTLFIFEWKYPFWANLVQKIKIISLSWHLIPILIQTCRIQWWSSLFMFLIRNIFFGQIWPKSPNYQFKLKFGNYNNSNMQNSIASSVHVFLFRSEMPFLGKFSPKGQNCQFNLKFRRYLLLRLKFRSAKVASFHPAFMANCPTISHMF